MKVRLGSVAVLLLLVLSKEAGAHPVPYSYIDVHLRQNAVEVSLVAHIYDLAHDLGVTPVERLLDPSEAAGRAEAIRSLVLSRTRFEINGGQLNPEWDAPEILSERQSIRLTFHTHSASEIGSISIYAAMFPYDPIHQTFVNVYESDSLSSQRILDSTHPETHYFSGTSQGVVAVIEKFVPQGIHHILIGPDHILFLVGLLLLGGTTRRLLLVVTSFTIAHSITLSLAALNVVNPPARFIEPAIALSIVYVGIDNLFAQNGRDVRAWIALAFGFIHGFGFANVLREMGLPSRALGWSLFSFNLGVEIGQLIVVSVIATALAALRSRSESAGRQVAFAGSIAVIIAGTFWFVQRVFFSGGV
jgi:hydrogenase/urease accessory protein HupE